MLQFHQEEHTFSGRGGDPDRDTFRAFLEAHAGLKWGVRNEALPASYVNDAVEYAAMIMGWD
jgi:hypothetical protein